MSINERISERLRILGITKKAAAERIGVPYTTFSGYIKLGRDIPAQHIVPLSEMLECSVLYLLTGTDNPLVIDVGSSSTDAVAVTQEAEKAPIPGISENGREMLDLYEQLPEREQLIFIGRLQEAVARLAGPASKEVGPGPGMKAV
jgi:hypothetical protein